jgi:hypothetical protein
MDQNNFEILLKKAEENKLTPTEKLTFIRELRIRLGQYNKVLEDALSEIPEEES